MTAATLYRLKSGLKKILDQFYCALGRLLPVAKIIDYLAPLLPVSLSLEADDVSARVAPHGDSFDLSEFRMVIAAQYTGGTVLGVCEFKHQNPAHCCCLRVHFANQVRHRAVCHAP